jgi:hypothetical protein
MDILEFIIILVVILALVVLIYYYLKGSTGKVSLASPIESRVDEYLDRRFQNLVEEWELVTQNKLQGFKERKKQELEQNESRVVEVKKFEADIMATLTKMEARLDAVEKELAQKGSAKK